MRFLIFLTAVLVMSLPVSAEDSSYYNQKGMDELRGNSPARAAEYFKQAISIDPDRKHYYNNLAAAYIRMGEYAKAEEQLMISLKLDSNYARALSNMSVTLFHLGRYGESYSYYLKSKKADSEYSEKRFNRKRIFSFIRKLSSENPENMELKKIREYMESDNETGEVE